MLGLEDLLERKPRAAVRRPAAARRDGPRDRARAEGVPHGRAALQPRRKAPRRDARVARAAAPAAGRHNRLRDPRPGRGDDAGTAGRGDARRADPSGRHAAAPVRAAAEPLRRRVHRLAGDEPRRRQRSTATRSCSGSSASRSTRGGARARERRRASCSASGPRASRTPRLLGASCRRSTSRRGASRSSARTRTCSSRRRRRVSRPRRSRPRERTDARLVRRGPPPQRAGRSAHAKRGSARHAAARRRSGALPLLRSARPAPACWRACSTRSDPIALAPDRQLVLTTDSVRRTASVTKQSQTRDLVLDLIEQLEVGEAIPSERQLSADLGVSRLTLRAALDDLAARGLRRAPARRGHVRERAEDRPGADDDVVHRRHAPARACGRPAERSSCASRLPGRASAASCTSRRRSRSCREPPSARRWRDDGDRDAARARAPRSRAHRRRSRGASFYELLSDRYGIVIVGGTQTIEPTVTDEEESAALGVPLHSPAFLFERVTQLGDGRDGRVRGVDLPRRPLPARHRARPSAGEAAPARGSCRRARRPRRVVCAWYVPHDGGSRGR